MTGDAPYFVMDFLLTATVYTKFIFLKAFSLLLQGAVLRTYVVRPSVRCNVNASSRRIDGLSLESYYTRIIRSLLLGVPKSTTTYSQFTPTTPTRINLSVG